MFFYSIHFHYTFFSKKRELRAFITTRKWKECKWISWDQEIHNNKTFVIPTIQAIRVPISRVLEGIFAEKYRVKHSKIWSLYQPFLSFICKYSVVFFEQKARTKKRLLFCLKTAIYEYITEKKSSYITAFSDIKFNIYINLPIIYVFIKT